MATLLELEKLEVLSKTLFKGNKKINVRYKIYFWNNSQETIIFVLKEVGLWEPFMMIVTFEPPSPSVVLVTF